MNDSKPESAGDYIVIKALEDGVSVQGITRGTSTRGHYTEKLNNGQVFIAQFTQTTSAMKIDGKATILTQHGVVESGLEKEDD